MKGGFQQGGLNFAPLPTPPKRHNLPIGLGGGGGRIQSGGKRKGRGRDYHEVDNDNDNNGKGGKQGKSINDGISEHKCILTKTDKSKTRQFSSGGNMC